MLSQACVFIACAVLSVQASCLEPIGSACSYGSNVESIPVGNPGCGYLNNYQPQYNVQSLPICSGVNPSCGLNVAPLSVGCNNLESYPTSQNVIDVQSPAIQPRVLDTSCVCTKLVLRNQPIKRLVTVKSVQRYVKTSYKPVTTKVAYNAQPQSGYEQVYPSQYPQSVGYAGLSSSCNSPIVESFPQSVGYAGLSSSCNSPIVESFPQSVGYAGLTSSCNSPIVESFPQSVGYAGLSSSCNSPIGVAGYSCDSPCA